MSEERKGDVAVGQLWLVVEDFTATNLYTKVGDRQCNIKLSKGEIVEVRFPYAWHLRTSKDDLYFHVEEEVLKDKCIHYANIHDETRFRNRHKLHEILEQELYTKVEREPQIQKLIDCIIS